MMQTFTWGEDMLPPCVGISLFAPFACTRQLQTFIKLIRIEKIKKMLYNLPMALLQPTRHRRNLNNTLILFKSTQ